METKAKNRDWVKNAAIIFLAVLLVLTFFSNTIMNRIQLMISCQSASCMERKGLPSSSMSGIRIS